MHPLKYIYTAHYRYSGADRTDITVKGQDAMGRYFAPTWSMVMGVKNGTMSEDEYVRLYLDQLQHVVPVLAWDWLLSQESRTLVCFCRQDAFCHRNILTRYLVQTLGSRIVYGGWRD